MTDKDLLPRDYAADAGSPGFDTGRRHWHSYPMPGRRDKGFHYVDVHVGARLRRREQIGMTLGHVAAAAGITYQQLQKYEAAIYRLSPSRLHCFARLLKVSVAYFFEGLPQTGRQPTPFTNAVLPEIELESRETAVLVEAYYRPQTSNRRRAFISSSKRP